MSVFDSFAFPTVENKKKLFTRVNNKIQNIDRGNEIKTDIRHSDIATFLINQIEEFTISIMVL